MALELDTSEIYVFFLKQKGRLGRGGFPGPPGPLVRPCPFVTMAVFSQDRDDIVLTYTPCRVLQGQMGKSGERGPEGEPGIKVPVYLRLNMFVDGKDDF